MTNRSVCVVALVGIGVGLMGLWATACSLQSGGTLGVDPDPEDSIRRSEHIAPAGGEELASPDFLKELGSNH